MNIMQVVVLEVTILILVLVKLLEVLAAVEFLTLLHTLDLTVVVQLTLADQELLVMDLTQPSTEEAVAVVTIKVAAVTVLEA
jgi:hypothetical protein